MSDGALVLVVGAACIVLGIVIGRLGVGRRTAAPESWTAQPAGYGRAPDIHSVRVGDAVLLEGAPGTVVATIGYVGTGAERWCAARVDLSTGKEWVSLVDQDPGLEVCRWTSVNLRLGSPERDRIEHDGRIFERREDGTAEYEAHGDVDLPSLGEVRYVEFVDGDDRLTFELYNNGDWEISLGRVVAVDAFRPRS